MGVKLVSPSAGSVEIVPATTAFNYTATLPAATGNVLVSTSVSASTTNTVTNKLAIVINGTTYYLLASTSGT
jgi:hypothetical protein